MSVVDTFTADAVTGELPVVASVRAVPMRRVRDYIVIRAWLVGVLVYVTAAFHRSSLGVAGLDAADRFGISAGALSVFVLLQLGVYAVMQVPTGILVDRFGPRRLLLAAALIMAVAQLIFSIAPSYPTALAARTLLGFGDALTFVSLLRFVSQHFSARRFPLVISLTGTIGALGSVVATVPLSMALDSIGWTPSFAAAAVASLLAAGAVWSLLPETTVARRTSTAPAAHHTPRVRGSVREAWANAGTRAGFWVHFCTMSFTAMFSVLWGQPYLVAQGFTRGEASAVLTLMVVAAIIASPIVGAVFAKRPAARVPFALTVALIIIGGWAGLIFGFGGTPPHGLLVVAVALSAVGGPASSIAFALARDYNEPSLVGTASGVVNVGGFSATIGACVVVGRLLDLLGADDAGAFRVAFAVAVAIPAFGAVQAVRWYRILRAEVLDAQRRGESVPVPAHRRRWDIATA